MEIKIRKKVSVLLVIVFMIVLEVQSAPTKTLNKQITSNANRRSKLLSTTILSDYWKERGFHDTPTDHLIASESQGRDLMLTGDEVDDFKGSSKVRIPRGRLTPPAKFPEVVSLTASISIPRRTKLAHAKRRQDRRRSHTNFRPLTKAQRKQDMEILESVTLMDGGVPTNMADGSVKIMHPVSPQQSQRKYHRESQEQESYEQDQHVAAPSIQASYHVPPPAPYQYQSMYEGKPANSYKQPKSLNQLTMEQFQREVQQTQAQQPHQPNPVYNQPLPSTPPSPQGHVDPYFLVQKQPQMPQNYQHPLTPPMPNLQQPSHPSQFQLPSPQPPQFQIPSPQPSQYQIPSPQTPQYQTPPPQLPQYQQQLPHQATGQFQQQQQQAQPPVQMPYVPPTPQPKELPFNTQLFQEQFRHPFESVSQPISSLAQITASILSTASGAANAAAKVLANGEIPSLIPSFSVPSPSIPSSPSQPEPRHPLISLPESSPIPPTNLPHLAGPMLSAAASIQSSEVLLPAPTTTSASQTAPSRPGVVVDDEPIANNQLVEPESLASQLTKMYETGRKILYFPKGVVDTVDTFLKQMERNPMVAYWGDKFFAKVFGDTSGT